MSAQTLIDLKLRIDAVEERNGRHIIQVEQIPEELEPYLFEVQMKRQEEPKTIYYLFYAPFLGILEAVAGPEVCFKLDTESLKLFFVPSPELFARDDSIPLSYCHAMVHRMYYCAKRKCEGKLYWCTELEPEKKKKKAVLLDVSKFCSSALPIDREPEMDLWPGSDLYTSVKISHLTLAIAKRDSEGDAPISPRSSKTKILGSRLRLKLHGAEEEMVMLSQTLA